MNVFSRLLAGSVLLCLITPSVSAESTRNINSDVKEYFYFKSNHSGNSIDKTSDQTKPSPLVVSTLSEPDSDGDLIPDSWETSNGLDPENPEDALLDRDSDGFINLYEYWSQTNIADPAGYPQGTLVNFEQKRTVPFYWLLDNGCWPCVLDLDNGNTYLEALGVELQDFWSFDDTYSSEGSVSLKSPEFPAPTFQPDFKTSFSISVVSEGGYVSFDHSLKFPDNYYYPFKLLFYINGDLVGEWSEAEFQRAHFKLEPGISKLEWEYIEVSDGPGEFSVNKSKFNTDSESEIKVLSDYGQQGISPGLRLDNIFITAFPEADTDSDGIEDAWELAYFDILEHDMSQDSDQDGLVDSQEWLQRTHPRFNDTDLDGIEDFVEINNALDPKNPEDAFADNDSDGFNNVQEHLAGSDLSDGGSKPQSVDFNFENSGLEALSWLSSDVDIVETELLQGNKSLRLSANSDLQVSFTSQGGFVSFLGKYESNVESIELELIQGPEGGDGLSLPALRKNGDLYQYIYKVPAGENVLSFSADGRGYAWLDDLRIIADTTFLDNDSDGISDHWEKLHFGHLNADLSIDHDNDGLLSSKEAELTSNPNTKDTDNDGLPDSWEFENSFDLLDGSGARSDDDNDGFSNVEEYFGGTSHTDSNSLPEGIVEDFESGRGSVLFWSYQEPFEESWQLYGESSGANNALKSASFFGGLNRSETVTEINTTEGYFSFDAKLSDNNQCGWLSLYIDETKHSVDLFVYETQKFVHPISAGTHSIKFVYQASDNDGVCVSDTADFVTIDNVFVTAVADSDGDGLPDSWEYAYFNGLDAGAVGDADNDGLTNLEEFELGTDPTKSDTDSDGLPDLWEVDNNFDPVSPEDAEQDSDADGVINILEFLAGTDVNDPNSVPQAITVDFNSKSYDPLSLSLGEQNPWSIDKDTNSEDNYVLTSHGEYGRDESASVKLVVYAEKGYVSFDLGGYFDYYNDELNFYIDGAIKGSWKGRTSPEFNDTVYFQLENGEHELVWESKRGSYSDIQDRHFSFIDNLSITTSAETVDADNDSVKDSWEIVHFDTLSKDLSTDTDGDGLTDQEESQYNSNPNTIDTDGDDIPDNIEETTGLNLQYNDGALDKDGDGFANIAEYYYGSEINHSESYPQGTKISFENNKLEPFAWKRSENYGGNIKWQLVSEGVASDGTVALRADAAYRTELGPEVELLLYSQEGYIKFDALYNAFGIDGQDSWFRFSIDGEDTYNIKPTNGEFKEHYYKLAEGLHTLTWQFYGGYQTRQSNDVAAWLDNIFITAEPGGDVDEDGVSDDWELQYFGTLDEDLSQDHDADGISSIDELALGTDPTSEDTDNDGLPDGWERNNNFDPLNSDDAKGDADNDGFNNYLEYLAGSNINDAESYPEGTLIDFEQGELAPFYWFNDSGWVVSSASDSSYSLQATTPSDAGHYYYSKAGFSVQSEGGYISFDIKKHPNIYQVAFIIGSVNEPGGNYHVIEDATDNIVVALPPGDVRVSWEATFGSPGLSSSISKSFIDSIVEVDNIFITAIPDSDDDGFEDSWELEHFRTLDVDMQADSDEDSLTNLEEYNLGTNPNNGDTDEDKTPDSWEVDNGLDPLNSEDAETDLDSDGFSNLEEYYASTLPNDEMSMPVGILVDFEENHQKLLYWTPLYSNPNWRVTDTDAIDGQKSFEGNLENENYSVTETFVVASRGYIKFDYMTSSSSYNDDFDFYVNGSLEESFYRGDEGSYILPINKGTYKLSWRLRDRYSSSDPRFVIDNVFITAASSDTDEDGIGDSWELYHYDNLEVSATDDTDSDGLSALDEFLSDSDPNDADTDSDDLPDGWEFENGLDPNDPSDNLSDQDNDGFTALEEYYADTLPNDGTSTPVVTLVDFEEGKAEPFYWGRYSREPKWFVTTENKITGDYSFSSKTEEDNYTSHTQIVIDSNKGFIKFDYKKTSSSGTAYVSVNGRTKETIYSEGSGQALIPLEAGINKVEWRYYSGSNIEHFPRFLIDNIIITAEDSDTDSDGVKDSWELFFYNNLTTDLSADHDSDGLSSLEEYQLGTNPKEEDTDFDGLPDNWEILNELNPNDASDSSLDPDSDNFSNLEEYYSDTDPNESTSFPEVTVVDFEQSKASPFFWARYSKDSQWVIDESSPIDGLYSFKSNVGTDGFGSTTQISINAIQGFVRFDYRKTASTGTGYFYVNNSSSNRVVFSKEETGTVTVPLTEGINDLRWTYANSDGLSGNPSLIIDNIVVTAIAGDSDDDGIDDSWEYLYFRNLTSSLDSDHDSDGLTNREEYQYGTNPIESDSDYDEIDDAWEVSNGLDPNDDSDALVDSDTDSFRNLEEFYADTDPTDSSSLPQGLFYDFEADEITPLDWISEGDADWFLSQSGALSGLQSLQSGEMSYRESATVKVALNAYKGFVKFDLTLDDDRCSYGDDVEFYIDNTRIERLCDLETQTFTYPITQGPHTIKWVHNKPYSSYYSDPSEVARIDNVFITASPDFDVTAPGSVDIVASSLSSGVGASIDWTSYDESANGDDIDTYEIYSSSSSFTNVENAELIASVQSGTKQYTVEDLSRNQTYYYAVVAVDIFGNRINEVTSKEVITKDIQAPANVTFDTVVSNDNSIDVSWYPSSSSDIKNYHVSLDDNSPVILSPDTFEYEFSGLSNNFVGQVKIRVEDFDGNISSGSQRSIATLYINPEIEYVEPLSGKVKIDWQAVNPVNGIRDYRIYVSESPISDISGLEPVLTKHSNTTSATIAQLSNGQKYYFAVAARNISNHEKASVISVDATPGEDTQGPNIEQVKFNNQPLVNGQAISTSGLLEIVVNDQSGVSRVETKIDGNLYDTLFNQSGKFTTSLNIDDISDGTHTLLVKAYDTLDHSSEDSRSFTVALNPPNAPVITNPSTSFTTNEPSIIIEATGEGKEFQVYNNDQAVNEWSTFTDNMSLTVQLVENENHLTVKTRNRGGVSPSSDSRIITLDSSVPETPTGLTAQAKEAGQIQLRWNAVQDENLAGYDIYRSTSSFSDISNATRINNNHLTKNSYTDLPFDDGQYYYRVVAINDIETPSAPSNEVTGLADTVLPTASISYEGLGQFDSVNNVYGKGEIKVTLSISEELSVTPFLAIKPGSAAIQMMALEKVDATTYTSTLNVNNEEFTGDTVATFSARDLVNNQGTEITEGKSITIDAKGPSVTELVLEPGHPIKNNSTDPVTVNVTLVLDEALKDGESPHLSYILTESGPEPIQISNLTESDSNTWTASFVLSSEAGLDGAESLEFNYSAIDELDNVNTELSNEFRAQVYQGDLPPLDSPFGLSAKSEPNGVINLSWYEVPEADDYQLYRKGPSESEFVELTRTAKELTYKDQTSLDGEYSYKVATVRTANNEETVSAPSSAVTASSDSEQPAAPSSLQLELTPVGVQVTWELSESEGIASYSLYRAETQPIVSVDSLEPSIEEIPLSSGSVVDPEPQQNLPAYVVVAVDEAGNLSEPSNTGYLNVDLLPVSALSVLQDSEQSPVVSWSHDYSEVAGFDIYLDGSETGLKLNSELLTEPQYIDTGFSNTSRQYSVIAVDANGVESLERSIFLPQINISLLEGESIKKGLINELNFTVENLSDQAVTNNKLVFTINGKQHTSESFDLDAQSSEQVVVIVGGYKDLLPSEGFDISFVHKPNSTEEVKIKRGDVIDVHPASLVLDLETKEFLRGGTGKVRFNLENTGESMLEIITALNNGNKNSTDLRFTLKDLDGNVLASQTVKQSLGDGVLTLSSGETVARVNAGVTFTSQWFELDIPGAAPENVVLELNVDNIYRGVGTENQVKLDGVTTNSQQSLVDTPYTGANVVATPESSFGDEPVIITGKAIDRDSQLPVPSAELKIVVAINGFEKEDSITTNSEGEFEYEYTPEEGESGVYKVSVIHPELTERPESASFVISKVVIKPYKLNVTIPPGFTQSLPLTVKAGDGTQLSNVRFELRAEDQESGELPIGVSIDFSEPVELGSKQYKKLPAELVIDNTADESGSFKLALLSDESSTKALGFATVNYTLTEAVPSLYYSPSFVETGVTLEGQVSETVTLENRGVIAMSDIQLELLRSDDFAAPDWISLGVANNLGNLDVGEKKTVDLYIQPQNQATPGVHEFKLRVLSSNHPTRDIPIYVSITESGFGGYQFKVTDMYTATLDDNGDIIQGLADATIRLQNEDVPSIEYSLQSNELGEAFFDDIPAGSYSYWVSASKHQEKHGRIQVRPGIVKNESVFLDYNLINLEWSVREITIEDRYEIILTATYEVDVPAAVVVLEPSSITLPDMEVGDVFYGELTLTNHGLIRAHSVEYSMPSENQFFQVEMLESALPESLEAKEVAKIPYRITSLQSLEPELDGSGGGCYTKRMCFGSTASYTCATGDDSSTSSQSCWVKSYGTCQGAAPGGGGGWYGGGGGFGGGGYGGGTDESDQEPLPQCRVPCEDCEGRSNGGGDQ